MLTQEGWRLLQTYIHAATSNYNVVPVNALMCCLLWGHMYSSFVVDKVQEGPSRHTCSPSLTSLCVCVCVCAPAGLTPSAPSCKQARSTDTSNLVQQFTGKQLIYIHTLHSWCDVFTNHLTWINNVPWLGALW